MFSKSLFTYLVIEGNSVDEAEYIVDILDSHDRRYSDSFISSKTVMVHMKITDDKEDLTKMLNSLKQQFPNDVKIIANPPYYARITTESKKKLKSFFIPALAGYIATILGIVMINWQTLSMLIIIEGLIASLFPAAAAIFLKIYEEYK
jgi:hypothetical protein